MATTWSRAGSRTASGIGFDPVDLLAVPTRQREAESDTGATLAAATAPTEAAVGSALAHTAVLAGRPDNAAPLDEAGRLLGRLAHLLDAVADLDDDAAHGRWNPLAATGTSRASALERCRDAVAGIRSALRRVAFDPEAGTARKLAHQLLVHEAGRAVDRTAAGVGAGHGYGAGPERPLAAVADPMTAPIGIVGDVGPSDVGDRAAGAPARPGTRRHRSATPTRTERRPRRRARRRRSRRRPPERPSHPPRGLLGGCAAAAGLCCTGQLCCTDEFVGPWSGQPRQGWCANCADGCSCGCDCCDCCSDCDGCCCDCDAPEGPGRAEPGRLSGGAVNLDGMAFATEVPGAARDSHHGDSDPAGDTGTLLDNPEGLPDDALAESEFRPIGEIERTGVPFEVVSPYQPAGDQPAAIDDLERRVRAGEHDVVLLGATGTGKSATTAWLIERVQRPTLVMAPNKTLAAQLANELRELLPNNAVEYFVSYYDYYQPEAYIAQTDTYIEKDSSINEDVERLRHSATSNLLLRRDVVVVASVSCIYGLGTPQSYLDRSVKLEVGEEIDRDTLLRALVDVQYQRNDMAFARGTFRVRGDTVEIIPAYEELAIRIEFFGDEIESLYYLNPLTGDVVNQVEDVRIFPATHYVAGPERMERAIKAIEQELEERLAELENQGKLLEAQRLRMRTSYDIEMMRQVGFCSGIENYSRHIDGRGPGTAPATLIDYFPNDFLLVIDESHVTVPQIGGMYEGDMSRKRNLVEYGFRLP